MYLSSLMDVYKGDTGVAGDTGVSGDTGVVGPAGYAGLALNYQFGSSMSSGTSRGYFHINSGTFPDVTHVYVNQYTWDDNEDLKNFLDLIAPGSILKFQVYSKYWKWMMYTVSAVSFNPTGGLNGESGEYDFTVTSLAYHGHELVDGTVYEMGVGSASKGDTGARGDTGVAGDTGVWGDTGARGDTGTQGDTGWQGDTGVHGPFAVSTKTGAYTLAATDSSVLVNAAGGAITITLPAVASMEIGAIFQIKKIDSSNNVVTIDANASETVDGELTVDLKKQYENVTLQCAGSSWIIL